MSAATGGQGIAVGRCDRIEPAWFAEVDQWRAEQAAREAARLRARAQRKAAIARRKQHQAAARQRTAERNAEIDRAFLQWERVCEPTPWQAGNPATETPENRLIAAEAAAMLAAAVDVLPKRVRQVLTLRFGLRNGRILTLEQTAVVLGGCLTRQRISQLERQGLALLGHPVRRQALRAGLTAIARVHP